MKPELSLESRVTPDKDVLFQKLQGEAVLLNLKTGVYFGLDQIGTRVWEALQRGETLAAVVQRVLDEYEVERERCENDLLKLVSEMEAQQLVRLNGPSR